MSIAGAALVEATPVVVAPALCSVDTMTTLQCDAGTIGLNRPRHTLASTASLFLPDRASPILLAPSESEIESDPRYYTFGAQLVTALVLFFVAYSLAYVVLGWVRRRERRAKVAWKAELQKQREAAAQKRRIPMLRPTLYQVAPAPLLLPPSNLDLDLSDPAPAQTILARVKRRARAFVDSLLQYPARWRRRRRADQARTASQAQNKRARQSARKVSSASADASSSSAAGPSAPLARRPSTFAAFSNFLARRNTLPAILRATSPEEEKDDATTLQHILSSFTAALPATLPWLSADAPILVAPKPRPRKASISDTLSNWTSAIAGPSPSPSFRSPPTSLAYAAQSTPAGPSQSSGVTSSSSPPNRAVSFSPPPLQSRDASDSLSLSSAHSDFPDEENEREFLTYSLATFVLAVSFVWIELLVLSVLASTTLNGVALNNHVVLTWCTKELVSILWLGTVWLSSISLFVLAPFGFLYYEAEGLAGRKGFISRVTETLLVLSAFTVLLYGSFHLLQSLLDRGGILNPFTFTDESESARPLEEFSLFDLFENTWLRLLLTHLERLYSNVWHFLPGLILLLVTCHQGFLALISGAYSVGVSIEIFSVATEEKRMQQINVIKCELATAERRWSEMELELSGKLHRARHSAADSARAIAPTQSVPLSQRQALLAEIESLRRQYVSAHRELQPTSLWVRIMSSPHLRNAVCLVLTIGACLLTWHIILRVAQREARLIFRGSIFRWFRSGWDDSEWESSSNEETGLIAAALRGFWWTLYSLKAMLGSVLSLLTGKGLSSKAVTAMPPLPTPVAAPLANTLVLDSPFLTGVVHFFGVLGSVLLGINSFQLPFIAFLADLACIGFFFFASARSIIASHFLEKFSPIFHMRHSQQLGANFSTSLLLFLPQFFTVNAFIMLLLTSSLPLASWMLGLSSFDLLEFYPQSSVQFATGSGTGVPMFVHLYNLSFLALTVWHATRVSKAVLVWIVLDQIVANIERLVERARVELGWAKKDSKPEERFQLFGRCRRAMATAGPPLTRWQTAKLVFSVVSSYVQWCCSPFVRSGWYVLRHTAMALYIVLEIVWRHSIEFVRVELEDDPSDIPKVETTVMPAVAPKLEDAASDLLRAESSTTAQLLAEVDAATIAAVTAQEHCEVKVDSTPDAAHPPMVSSFKTRHRRSINASTSTLAFFARSISAPARLDLDAEPESPALFSMQAEPEADVDPLLGLVPSSHSPLYRSRTVAAKMQQSACRLLTTDTSNANAMDGSGFEETHRSITEADFPQFSSPIATVQEEEEKYDASSSVASSAAPTPHFSPYGTPLSLQHRIEEELLDISGATSSTAQELAEQLPPLELSFADSFVDHSSDSSHASDASFATAAPPSSLILPPPVSSPLLSARHPRYPQQQAAASQSTSSESDAEGD